MSADNRCPHCGQMPRHWDRWKPNQVVQLRRWWNDGLTAGQIVRKFRGEFSRSAILGKVCRLGLQRNRTGAV